MRDRTPAQERLEPLAGEWRFEAIAGGRVVLTGSTTFAWLEDGAFLLQHAEADPPGPETPVEWIEHSPFPVRSLIGLDDANDRLVQLYTDGRGIFRIYEMTLAAGVWTLQRDAPGFCQRFRGTFSADGAEITGAFEQSPDGDAWTHDFDIRYRKVR
jgi:hypothetical protein